MRPPRARACAARKTISYQFISEIAPASANPEPVRRVCATFARTAIRQAQTARAEEMAGLATELKGNYPIGHDRSARYYAWRFDNPRRVYTFVYCIESDAIRGFLVIQTEPGSDPGWGRIVDWRAASLGVYAALLDGLLGSGIARSYRLWNSGLSEEMHRLNNSAGFAYLRNGRRPTVLYAIVGTSDCLPEPVRERMHDQRFWDLRMIDTDGY